MNKKRRQELDKAVGLLEQARGLVDKCQIEEQISYENLPEGIRYSDSGLKVDENAQNLGYASEHIGDAINSINETITR